MGYKTFIYDEARNFIFVYVPKVSCTNWKSILRYLAGFDNYLDSRLAHDKQNGGLRYLELNGPDAPDWGVVKDASVPKYAFVRDPYARVLSAYLNKVESRLPLPEEAEGEEYFLTVTRDIDRFRREALDVARYPQIDLTVFLKWLEDGTSRYVGDEHWQKQVVLLRWKKVEYDFVGRFENLAEEAPVLLEKMGCDIPFPSQKDVKFPPTNAVSKIDRYYTPESFALVSKLYAEDFDALGYERRD